MLSSVVVGLLAVVVVAHEIQERAILQPLDHFSEPSSARLLFSQRYFVDNQYYRPGGPILIYSVGERTALASDLSDGWIGELARETGGLAVLLEQRFYGDSIPDPLRFDTANGTNVLQYLSVEHIMADIKRFVEQVNRMAPDWVGPPRRHGRRKTPIVLVGGSFAGSLMVWTKQRYPDLESLAIASSAPLRAVDGYWEFDKMMAERLPCARALSEAVRTIDEILDRGDAMQIAALKRRFGLEHVASDNDFVAALAIQASSLIQAPAGLQSKESIAGYCSEFGRPGLEFAAGIEALARVTRKYGQSHRIVPTSECPETGDDLAWLWQQCTELGMWQTAPLQNSTHAAEAAWFPHRLRSRRLSVDFYEQQCDKFSSDVLLTAGELDPWLYLTAVWEMRRLASNALLIGNASHAEDLIGTTEDGQTNPEVLGARLKIIEAVEHNGDNIGRQDEQQTRGVPPPAGFASHGGQALPPPPGQGFGPGYGLQGPSGQPPQGQGFGQGYGPQGHGGPSPPPGQGYGRPPQQGQGPPPPGYSQGQGPGGPPPPGYGQQQQQGSGEPSRPRGQGAGDAGLQWVTASNGHIPPNPVQGGIESDGRPLFVARAIYKGGLHPGKAGQHLGGGGCTIGYGHKEIGISEYQVLCGDASKLRWVAQEGTLNIQGCVAFPAGHEESGEPLYVAKTLHDRSQQLGKCAPHIKKGMSFPYGHKELTTEKYMVLCYADAKGAAP
ncbi:hypothetical protein IWW39_004376 [Coemansia spiralis]|uniref:Uncharacterized protein n=1 Tax=Coemansia spiralis TaxID=417178 RepID=A0A9W8GHG0_9FUNG|nr:hypothetical protein IWW39_004376 [Coemansia spiralis]